ncbi:MAG: L,D-transpeptidase family protein [Chthoniobacterales bacterium]
MCRFLFHVLPIAVLALSTAIAGEPGAAPGPRPLSELIVLQEPPKVVPRVLESSTPEKTSITISLGRQRACLLVGDEVAIDSPVSSGKPRGMTPKGDFTILEKTSAHSTRFYGDFVDPTGNPLRLGVSTRIDPAPSGTTFREMPVQYYLRLNDAGLALYAGPLPGYPAADTAVRLPTDIAPLFFQRVKVGTPVKIAD